MAAKPKLPTVPSFSEAFFADVRSGTIIRMAGKVDIESMKSSVEAGDYVEATKEDYEAHKAEVAKAAAASPAEVHVPHPQPTEASALLRPYPGSTGA